MRFAILAFAVFLSPVPASPQTDSGTCSREALLRQNYFPAGIFNQNPNAIRMELYDAAYLCQMGEPSLLQAAKDSESTTYRFLLLGNHRGFSARLTLRADGNGEIDGRELVIDFDVKDSRYTPHPALRKGSLLVRKEQVHRFLALLQKAGFWSMKTNDDMPVGLDGTHWILEGVRNHNYHVVDRWSPENGDYKQVCSYLIDISPIKLDERVWDKGPY